MRWGIAPCNLGRGSEVEEDTKAGGQNANDVSPVEFEN